MTLVAVHRLPRSAVFLSDTRLTETVADPADGSEHKVQGDEVAKFINVDGRLRLFAAGPVSFWQAAQAEIEAAAPLVTLDNADETNEPLHEALDCLAGSLPMRRDEDGKVIAPNAGALGFVLDTQTGTHKVLSITISFGLGATVEAVAPGDSRLIGTGAQLPGLEERFRTTAAGTTRLPIFDEESPDPLVTLFNGLRQTVLTAFAEAGPGAHAQLNTGSVFVGGVLLNDWSCLIGERVDEYRSSGGSSSYTVGRDGDALVVSTDDKDTMLTPLSRAATHVTGQTIDPQRREQRADLQDRFPDAGVVYRVVQWHHNPSKWQGLRLGSRDLGDIVREGIGADARVFRSVYRIDLTTRAKLTLASRQSDPLSEDALSWYPDVDDYFEVSQGIRDEFEHNVKDHAFDHDWWRRFVLVYNDLLFTDPEALGRPPTS